MRAHIAFSALTVCVLAASGCATTSVRVSKVTADASPAGIRYSLPQPFLLVTPDPSGDGRFEAKVIYLPDESQTYAIDASTRRGKYTLDVAVADGLLSKLAWVRDDAAVAAEQARAAAEVAKAEITRRNEEEQERDTEAEAERKAAREKLDALQEDLRKKQLDVELADAEVRAAEEAINTAPAVERAALQPALRAARLKAAQERLRLAAAEAAVTLSEGRVSALAGAMNDPSTGGVEKPPAEQPKARFWGPVLYRIVDDPRTKSVRLVAVRWDDGATQLPLETAAPPKPTPPPAAEPKLTNLTPIALAFPAGANQFELTLAFDKPLAAIDTQQSLLIRTSGPNEIVPASLNLALNASDPKLVTVTLLKVPAGTYDLHLRFTHGANNTSASVRVPLTVTVQ
jgi:hypothetical protein